MDAWTVLVYLRRSEEVQAPEPAVSRGPVATFGALTSRQVSGKDPATRQVEERRREKDAEECFEAESVAESITESTVEGRVLRVTRTNRHTTDQYTRVD
ncbi:hypothetical protein WH47_00076 [Habropoda laboriosa]|uniref:Uncharacterized protein n=1 Tax=Habropoda laboriosa TaxID=597456 RepID=A0A0L7RKF4_9HYME|nr:hypothetical protein WH47_00076 [Habropoda laboriosa]